MHKYFSNVHIPVYTHANTSLLFSGLLPVLFYFYTAHSYFFYFFCTRFCNINDVRKREQQGARSGHTQIHEVYHWWTGRVSIYKKFHS